MTERLYDKNAYMQNFNSKVISCDAQKERFAVVLEQTAFFPEGGGQPSDTGKLNEVNVLDVQEKNGVIIHYTDNAIEAGTDVTGQINWNQRYSNMQNHSGEHIISGIIHEKFGFNNVGFHLGSEDITVDIDGELTKENLRMVERIANQAVYENIDIVAEYPSPEELKDLEYRSKLDLTENVRIVTIGKYDKCACCAPHVAKTGEIGIIKILDFERYKGGVRIHMLCGSDALDDYNCKYDNISEISVLLSAKQCEAASAVKRIINELNEEKRAKSEIKKELIQLKIKLIEPSDSNICIFENKYDMNDLRAIVNEAVNKCEGICAAFSGNDEKGYQYVIGSNSIKLKERSKEINTALKGKGGGAAMIQGSVTASKTEIEEYIKNFK